MPKERDSALMETNLPHCIFELGFIQRLRTAVHSIFMILVSLHWFAVDAALFFSPPRAPAVSPLLTLSRN